MSFARVSITEKACYHVELLDYSCICTDMKTPTFAEIDAVNAVTPPPRWLCPFRSNNTLMLQLRLACRQVPRMVDIMSGKNASSMSSAVSISLVFPPDPDLYSQIRSDSRRKVTDDDNSTRDMNINILRTEYKPYRTWCLV